jgi:nucleoid-associated protein YgaU
MDRVAEPPRERIHRVVDGDSLRLLALRYYGDENRIREILTANQAVLGSGELLPVGKTIIIPPLDSEGPGHELYFVRLGMSEIV